MKRMKNTIVVIISLAISVMVFTGCQSERNSDPNSTGENYTFDETPVIKLMYGDVVHESSNEAGVWENMDYWDGLYPYQVIELARGEQIDIEFDVMPDITIMRRFPQRPETELISTGIDTITIPDIEEELIYAIKAQWPDGYAFYVFRIINPVSK